VKPRALRLIRRAARSAIILSSRFGLFPLREAEDRNRLIKEKATPRSNREAGAAFCLMCYRPLPFVRPPKYLPSRSATSESLSLD
jgi:hypothetical protein